MSESDNPAMSDKTLAYLATPYTKRQRFEGLDGAAWRAAEIAARLLRAGVHAYAPIVYCHELASLGACYINPLDRAVWQPFCDMIAMRCDTLIVAHMEGWQESEGIAHEVELFGRLGKPIFDLPDITTCTLVRRPDTGPPRDMKRLAIINAIRPSLQYRDSDY